MLYSMPLVMLITMFDTWLVDVEISYFAVRIPTK